MLDFSHIAGFSFYQRKCMDGSCEKCGLYNIMMMRSMSRALPELTANGKKKRKKKVVGLPTGAIVLPVSGAAVKKSRKKKGVTVPIPAGVPGIGTVGIEPAGVPGIGTVGIEPAGVPGVRTVGTEPAGVPEIGTVGTEPAGVSGIGPDDARGVVGIYLYFYVYIIYGCESLSDVHMYIDLNVYEYEETCVFIIV
jgi:hypothetical protein